MGTITDSFFIKGYSHKICEDYACHADNMAALSDGCSSVIDSHIGAMVLAEQALKIKNIPIILDRACSIIRLMEKDLTCLHATLGVVDYSPYQLENGNWVNKEICGYLQGDGYLWTPSGEEEVSYSGNVPWYPYYSLNEDFEKTWKSFNQKKIGSDTCFHDELVVLFSDGVSSFTDKGGNLIPSKDIVKCLTDFKSFSEGFITRRANRCFKKIFPDLGWVNQDDVSIIGLYKIPKEN